MPEEAAVAVATPVEKTPTKKEKPVKAATPKAARAKVVKKPAAHPKYSEMIGKAIVALKDRNGSSRVAIEKYIAANFNVGGKVNSTHLKQALKKGVAGGSINQVKGVGASGSFKVSKPEKSTDAKPKVKKAVAKKPAAKKTPAKKPLKKTSKPSVEKKAAKPKSAAKKPVAKKTPTKPAAKKIVKKPVAKKVSPRKPSVKKPKVAAKPKKVPTKN